MASERLLCVLGLLLLYGLTTTESVESFFVCHVDAACAENSSRPIFLLGDSVEECCGMPLILSVLERPMDDCYECGPSSVERVTPRHIALEPPEALVLEIRATGFTAITWIQNGTAMHDFLRLELEENSKRLILQDTTPEDYGLYEADVHTISGDVLVVDFVVAPFHFPSVTANESDITDDHVNLTCTATGNPPPTVSWITNNQPLTPQYEHIVDGSLDTPPASVAILEVYAANATGEELYICVAESSQAGVAVTAEDSLYLRSEPPTLTRIAGVPETSVTVPDGIVFNCSTSGRPTPSILWMKDGALLVTTPGGRVVVTEAPSPGDPESVSSAVSIAASAYEDRGSYSCVASNIVGEQSLLFQLTVLVPPNVTVWPTEVQVNILDPGQAVMVLCEAIGSPEPQVVWVTSDGGRLNGFCAGPMLGDVFGEADYDFYDRFVQLEDIEEVFPETNVSSDMGGLRNDSCHISLMVAGSDRTVSTLTIYTDNIEQSANFTCIAENRVLNRIGTPENATVELSVVATPLFLASARPHPTPSPIITTTVEFNCTVIGQTPPSITWYKDNSTVLDGSEDRISIVESVQGSVVESLLQIVSVEVADGGTYTCEARNEDGVNSTSTTLNVRAPANITVPPEDIQTNLLETVAFTCQASGHPLPIISWARVNGSGELEFLDDFSGDSESGAIIVSSETNTSVGLTLVTSVLEVRGVQREDEGSYICLASNGVFLSSPSSIRSNATATLLLIVSPVITERPSDGNVTSPQTVQFTCAARGIPLPMITWYRGSSQLTDGDQRVSITYSSTGDEFTRHSTLQVDNTELSDAGEYSCVAENSAGNDTASFSLTVNAGPVFTERSSTSRTITSPQTVQFTCAARGFPLPMITWNRGSSQLTDGDQRVSITYSSTGDEFTNHSTLQVGNTELSDAGQYSCVAENPVSSFTAIFFLTVNAAPVVTVEPSQQIVTLPDPGAVAMFTCEAVGSPLPVITWFSENRELSMFCRETGMLGESEEIEELIDMSDRYNRCMIAYDISGTTNSTAVLMVHSLQLNDSGNYICEASNGIGTPGRASATLIMEAGPVFTERPSTRTVTSPQTIQFTCAARGIPLPMITWYRGSSQLTDGDQRVSITYSVTGDEFIHHSTLQVDEVELGDAGEYSCVTENPAGNDTASFSLTVNAGPVFTERPSSRTVTSPQTIQFTCAARGFPLPMITWYRGSLSSQLTDGDQRVSITYSATGDEFTNHSTLQVGNTELSDAGQYSCVAENPVSSVDPAIFFLTVNAAPVVTVEPSQQRVTLPDPGAVAMFTCEAVGSPLPVVTWFSEDRELSMFCRESGTIFDGEGEEMLELIDMSDRYNRCMIAYDTSGSTNSTAVLIVCPLQLNDSGNYICEASNGIGTPGRASATLTVEVEPRAIVTRENPTQAVREGGNFTVLCEAYGVPAPMVTWLKDTTTLEIESENSRLVISLVAVSEFQVTSSLFVYDILPSDEGEYKCRLDNHNVNGRPVVGSIQIRVQSFNDCLLSAEDPSLTPCQNNGTCVDRVGTFECLCTANFTGPNCENTTGNITQVQPVITNNPEDKSSPLFSSVNFTCVAIGEPDPTYSWFRDGQPYINTTDPVLCIDEVRPEDRGRYTCVAINTLGSSNSSSPGLLSIPGVFQYLAHFNSCNFDNFMSLTSNFSECLAGRILEETMTTIFSITPRPVPSGPSPENEIVITVVTNGTGTEGIRDELRRELLILTGKFGCQFHNLERFDGCPEERYALSEEFEVSVLWLETEINRQRTRQCPCGSLNTSLVGRELSRVCGGSYSFGAEWEDVQDDCDFSTNTFQLCNITTLEVAEQAGALVEVTEAASTFSPLDFTIASTIMQDLAASEIITTDRDFQTNFTGSFDNLLDTSMEAISESQEAFQSSSRLLNSLTTFGGRIRLENTTITNFTEQSLQLQVEEVDMMDFSTLGQSYTPSLISLIPAFQENNTETPIQGATIELPNTLMAETADESRVGVGSLRVINYALLRGSLFSLNSTSDLATRLASGDLVLSNVIIAANLTSFSRVEGLSEPVLIRYVLTEGLNQTNTTNATCVFWELPSDTPFGTWSTENCSMVSMEGGEIVCQCNHLTHFGLLLDINPTSLDPGVQLSLEIITYIGLILSLICLLIIIPTYLSAKKLRRRLSGRMLVHMCFALIGLYVSFLLAIHGQYYTEVLGFCYFVSVLLHYFMLVYFLWTAIEAVNLYLKLVRVFSSNIRHFVLKAAAIAWGAPLLVIAASAIPGIIFDLYAVYIDGELTFCRPDSWPFYFGVVLPFGAIFLFDLVVFFIIMASLFKSMRKRMKIKGSSSDNRKKEYRQLAVIAFVLAVMFGFGWGFGLVVSIPPKELQIAAQYVFSILIGFHGVLIFILHGMRSQDARNKWRMWFSKVCSCYKPPKLTVSSTGHYTGTTPAHKKSMETLASPFGGTTERRKNPLYESQENVFSTETGTTFVMPTDSPRKEDKETISLHSDPYASQSIEALSYASQTLIVDFPTGGESTEDEDEEFTIDLTELNSITAFVNTNFQYPQANNVEFVTTQFGTETDEQQPQPECMDTPMYEASDPVTPATSETTQKDNMDTMEDPKTADSAY